MSEHTEAIDWRARTMKYVLKVSYGNDSIALIQWAREEGLQDAVCLFSDTGWAADWWPARVENGETWARSLGFATDRTASMGMEGLVKWRRGWPGAAGGRFCTEHLKILPYQRWLAQHDPDKNLIAVCGVRRQESHARRSWPEWVEESNYDVGRPLWSPLVNFDNTRRDEMIRRAGWEPLPHRSRECWPCVKANKSDLVQLGQSEPDILRVEQIEKELGFTRKGMPKVMFRSAKRGGASGIREVLAWAAREKLPIQPKQLLLGGCDSGFCED